MTYTANHHLPQWVENDRVRMEDFNGAMKQIEDGLNAEAADNAAIRGELADAVDGAVAHADAGDAALDARVTALELRKFAYGYYNISGSNVEIDLGFTPKAVLIHWATNYSSVATLVVEGLESSKEQLILKEGGFIAVHPKSSFNGKYTYIAFG